MDKYSFLNAAHTAHFAELYDQYLINPDSVEPSWRAFFQGFDFGMEQQGEIEVPEDVLKEFRVVKLIDAYRGSGHLFTKTNPVRERRKYRPTLAIENFGLSQDDLTTVFSAGDIIGIGAATLADIIIHLERIYCASIGIEYIQSHSRWVTSSPCSRLPATEVSRWHRRRARSPLPSCRHP